MIGFSMESIAVGRVASRLAVGCHIVLRSSSLTLHVPNDECGAFFISRFFADLAAQPTAGAHYVINPLHRTKTEKLSIRVYSQHDQTSCDVAELFIASASSRYFRR